MLIEASTDSEWVARCLEALGHEVMVADPNFAPMYATRTRKGKTDRRDARALAEACLLGAYRPAYRLSDPQRHVRGRLLVLSAFYSRSSRTSPVSSSAQRWIRRVGRPLRSGPATAAKATFALTHPTNLRETRARIVRASLTRSHARGGDRSRSGTTRRPNALGLEHATIPEQRIEDAGEAPAEGDDGHLFAAACGDTQGPNP